MNAQEPFNKKCNGTRHIIHGMKQEGRIQNTAQSPANTRVSLGVFFWVEPCQQPITRVGIFGVW
jgi:hypothetical protein